MNAEQLVKTYQDVLAGCNERNADGILAGYAPGAKVGLIDSGISYTGHAIAGSFYPEFWNAFPDYRVEQQVVLVNGKNLAAIEFIHGTHKGTWRGVAATGKRIGLVIGRDMKFDDHGHILVDNHYYDGRTIMGQIGHNPRPHRPARDTGLPESLRGVHIAKGTPDESENAALSKRQIEVFTEKNTPVFKTFLKPDGTVANNTNAHDAVGSDAIGHHVDEFHVAFPDSVASVIGNENWGAGDWVSTMVNFAATNTGKLMSGDAPTGKKVSVTLLEIRYFQERKIKNEWIFINGIEFRRQLGLP